MAHFQFETSVNELVRLNAPVGGPKPRWQRKQEERRGSSGCGNALTVPLSPSTSHRRPSASKTPSKSPHNKSPRNNTTPKCKSPIADRFIPNRSNMDLDKSHFMLTRGSGDENEAQTNLQTALNEGPQEAKILSFKQKAPKAADGYYNSLRVLYSSSVPKSTTKAASTRLISTAPDRVLDAPDLRDDFYLKLIDWGDKNIVAVALGCAVYLWSANSGQITTITQVDEPDYISGVSWLPGWSILAVGLSNGSVELWDVEAEKRLRCMSGHAGRISSMSWNANILSSGSASGRIHNHDVRVADHHVGSWTNHEQEVCGLAWSPAGKYLASGGNDNSLNIWDAENNGGPPVCTMTHHMAAVKALAWCPWQQSILASGAGTADRTIRFWNVDTGLCLNTIDTGSQVSGILWSQEYKELISGHGFSDYHLSIWKYPSMKTVTRLRGHVCRILAMTQSPDGETVMTAGGDETLQIWNCFKSTKLKKSKAQSAKACPESKMSLLARSIR